jgi:hypothetical protein
VHLLSGRAVAQPLLGGRRGVGEGEAEGVVVDEAEGQGGPAAGQAGRVQCREECLGQGQGRGAERVAGLEQGGDTGMVLQDRPQPVRERGDLRGPGQGGVGPAVDLGEHRVENEIVELFLAADVAVQRAGNHAEAACEGAHAEGLRAIGADDREGLGDDTLTGERAAAALRPVRRVEPERARVRVFGLITCHACLPAWPRLVVNGVHGYAHCSSEVNHVHLSGAGDTGARPAEPPEVPAKRIQVRVGQGYIP